MQQALSFVRQARDGAAANDLIPRNPCDGVKAPTAQPKTDDIPTAEEAEAIIAAAAEDRIGALAYLALRCGMRSGELRACGGRWATSTATARTW